MHTAALFLALALVTAASAQDWVGFRGLTARGCAPTAQLLGAWPEDGLAPVWEQTIGDGGGGTYAGVTVAGSHAYLTGRQDDQDVLVCVDAATGKVHWRQGWSAPISTPYGTGPLATPLIHGDAIYLMDRSGILRCRSIVDGDPRWQVDLLAGRPDLRPVFGMAASPVVADGHIVAVGHGLMGLDPQTGAMRWRCGTGRPGYATPQAVTIAGELQIIWYAAAGLSACTIDGRLLWRYPMEVREGKAIADPLVIGSRVIVGTYDLGHGQLEALDIAKTAGGWSARPAWTRSDLALHSSSPLQMGDDWFLVNVNGHELHAVSLDDGRTLWQHDGFGSRKREFANISLVRLGDQHVAGHCDTGRLVLIQATRSGYDIAGDFPATGGRTFAFPAVAHGRLYVRDWLTVRCFAISQH